MALIDRLLMRHAQTERLLSGARIEFPLERSRLRQVELARPAGELLDLETGVDDGNFSSWMPGLPLPALLAARRRLTVDLAPVFLRNARPNYGISEKTMIALAGRRMLLFNVRDFDAPASGGERMAAAVAGYAPYAALQRLLDRAPQSVYFLAALRHPLFDAVSKYGARRGTLREFHEEADALRPTTEAAAALGDTDPAVLSVLFRGQRTPFEATRWHWAYMNSVASFVPTDAMEAVRASFERLAGAAPNDVIATLLIQFQKRMRYMQLAHSAPLSASVGGPYGMSLRDDYTFVEGVKRAEAELFEFDYMPNRLLDLVPRPAARPDPGPVPAHVARAALTADPPVSVGVAAPQRAGHLLRALRRRGPCSLREEETQSMPNAAICANAWVMPSLTFRRGMRDR